MDIIPIQLNKEINTPMYLQLSSSLGELIKSGKLKPKEKLPAIRKLANDLEVNNITVVNAYKQLETNGYIKAIKGSGYYVLQLEEQGHEKKTTANSLGEDEFLEHEDIKLMSSGQIELTSSTINFASATPDPSIFPIDAFKNCLNEVLDRDKGYAFGYQESNGFEPLRESLCNFLKFYNNINVKKEYIQIVSGAQQGIDIIGKTLLNPGDYVITENPTYTGAVSVFKSRGAQIVGVPINENGIDLKVLERQIIRYNPKLIYVMTRYQSPTTISYSKENLEGLLKLSEKYKVYIVEDDSLAGLSFENSHESPSLKSLDTMDKVIYIKSFSKLLMPGLRIGFIVSPENLSSELLKAKHSTDISSSGLIQRALHLYFEKGHWEDHINYMKDIYKEKYEAMLRELNDLKKYGVTFIEPKGGLNFWVTLPQGVEATKLYLECAKEDVLIVPCKIFYVNNYRNNDNTIRLSYAATNLEQIKTGMKVLEASITKILNKSKGRTYMSPMI
ncbi:PLP-dependent aminotransferase family protein [Clostridium tunisiense]|uniref:MocR-like pyridoxine biosynthesis transcription factor PdxR n=1 Tax=Clostridium tunisiense TaxID=219748 RepID=UPI0002D282F7|nr:PLP-dependent aminotransferase family protein [Clostridium tunisiense]